MQFQSHYRSVKDNSMNPDRDRLIAEIKELAVKANWPADKQAKWLKKYKAESWETASFTCLKETAHFVRTMVNAFNRAPVDTLSSTDDTNALRVYIGEDGSGDED